MADFVDFFLCVSQASNNRLPGNSHVCLTSGPKGYPLGQVAGAHDSTGGIVTGPSTVTHGKSHGGVRTLSLPFINSCALALGRTEEKIWVL